MFITTLGSAYHPFLGVLGVDATKLCVRKNLTASRGCPHMNATISSGCPNTPFDMFCRSLRENRSELP